MNGINANTIGKGLVITCISLLIINLAKPVTPASVRNAMGLA